MDSYNEMLDVDHCLRKEPAYHANARAIDGPQLKSTCEAAAREYRYRALLLKESRQPERV
jgi:hypothetical protein